MAKRRGVSIKDVARESNASLTTVSLVLNNRDRRISPATRERVLETVKRLGYRPSRLAQGLQAQKSGFFGILLPQLQHVFADVYFGELISAIHDHASQAGLKIILEVAHPPFIEKRQHLELFDRHFIDGLLCMGVTNTDDYLADFVRCGHPVIVVNNRIPGINLSHVQCDYESAGRLAAEHLLSLGHRDVGFIHGAAEVQTSADLYNGFAAKIADAGGKLPNHRVEDGLYTEEGGAAAARLLLQRTPNLTAIMAGNDKMAIGALTAIKETGRRVPQDISLIGCDDVRLAQFSDPPLTTVHTPIYEIGRRACERLMDMVEGVVDTVQETHAVSMTVRKSTAPIKK